MKYVNNNLTTILIVNILYIMLIYSILIHEKSNEFYFEKCTHQISAKESLITNEISTGFYIKEKINKNSIQNTCLIKSANPLCIQVLFANFANRYNSGSFRAGISLDGQTQTIELDARKIRDNHFYKICYPTVPLNAFLSANESFFFLQGNDSPPGQSIAAWTTEDLSLGKIEDQDTKYAGRSLNLEIGCGLPVDTKKATILNIFYLSLTFLLSLCLYKKVTY